MRLKFAALLISVLLFSGYAKAYDFSAVCESGQTLYYDITSNTEPYTVEVVRNGNVHQSGDLIIPETVVYNNITYYVTRIYVAFHNCSELTSVTIPNSVTDIGYYSFNNCSGLTSVRMGDHVENIGTGAFEDCTNLGSITLPNSLTFIDYGAFRRCSGLTGTLTIPNSVTSIGRYAFYDCAGLTGTLIIPDAVTFIGEEAFAGCLGLTELTINGAEEIGPSAFFGCSSLTTVTIGDSVTRIPSSAFCSCTALTTLTIGNSVTEIGGNAFDRCSSLNSITFGNSLTSISVGAFRNCSALATLIIPNSVTSIGREAFEGCSGLSSVVIPNSVTSIDNETFRDCSGLTSIIIPNSITSIGYSAFYGSHLSSLTIGNSVMSIGDLAFHGCENTLEVLSYNATNCATSNIFKNFINISTLNIGNNVTNIPAGAFYGCTGLTSVGIPNSVESIGDNAFYMVKNIAYGGNATGSPWGALSLNGYVDGYLVYSDNTKTYLRGCGIMATEVALPNSVTSIGSMAFLNCNRLTTITIPNSVQEIGANAFNGCSGLVEMTLPFVGKSASYTVESDSTLFGYIFGSTRYTGGKLVYQYYTPTSYKTYYIPNGLRTINFNGDRLPYGAFYGCTMLSSVTLGEDLLSIGRYAFYRDSLTEILIPENVTTIGDKAFGLCSNLSVVNFDATNCTQMGSASNPVFYNCDNFSDLRIGENVTNIPAYSFYNCGNLGAVSIPSSVLTIGDSAFYMVANITYYGTATGRPWGALSINAYEEDGLYYTSMEKDTLVAAIRTITSADIPNTVVCIMPNAFKGCNDLESLSIGSSVRTIGKSAFKNCTSLTAITIPNSVETIGDSAFSLCRSLTEIIIPDYVETIGESAFSGCRGITTLTIGRSVTSIGNSAFSGCTNLNTVNYNATACSYMGDNYNTVFQNCFSFTTLIIGDNVTKIPDYAFAGCNITGELIIPNSVITIGNRSFVSCQRLTAVTIGESVQGIGSNAFLDCHSMAIINFNAVRINDYYSSDASFFLYNHAIGVLNIGENVATFPRRIWGDDFIYFSTINVSSANTTFDSRDNCNAIIETSTNTLIFGCRCTIIPNSVTRIGNKAFYNCGTMTSITIPNSVTSIGNNAFYGCDYLTEVVIPNSVTSLGEKAFYGCNGLTSVTIGNSLENIGERVFFYCIYIDNIYMKSTEPPAVSLFDYSTYQRATLWVPCGSLEAYSTWNNFEDIREDGSYMLNATSANPQYGIAQITQHPNCTDGIATISAIAHNHCHFVQWNDGNTDSIRTITVTADTTYTAYFISDQHSVAVVSADNAMGTVSGSGTYDYGSEIEILATASEHYHFVQWNDGNTDNPRTIIVTGDTTYTATFAINQYTIAVVSADETMGTVSEGGTYDYGTEIQISATASEHYHFVQWNDGNTDNPRTITVNGDSTYTAEFAIDQHNITVVSADDEMGSVSGSGTYDYGSEIVISATENEGHAFIAWNDGNTDNTRTITVTGDSTYTATFGVLRNVEVYSSDESMGHVIGSGEYVEGAEIQITAIPNEHYHFLYWIENDNPSRGLFSDNPLTIIVTNGVSYTAIFAIDQHIVTVVSDNDTMGTVLGSGSYEYGSEIEISANANNGYQFEQWDDGNTDNPRTITVTEDVTYTAQFAIIIYHTIVVRSLSEDWGTVSGGGTFPSGSEIQILAIPNPDYTFVAWTDGNTDNPRTIIVTEDAEYVAAFTWAGAVEQTNFTEIAIFPNPANDILNITSSEEISEIEIVNTLGQVVFRMEVNSDNAVCDVNGLASGVYVVKIQSPDAMVVQKKFIKE